MTTRGPRERITITREVPKLRLICVSIPEMGHLLPILHIAKELASRGHDVQLVACSFVAEKIAAECENSGVSFVGVCGELQHESSGQGEIWDLKEKQGRIISANRLICSRMEEPLSRIIKEAQPDLVITATHCFSLFDLLDRLHVPYVVNFPGSVYRLSMTFWPLSPYIFCAVAPLMGMPAREAFGALETMKSMVRNQHTRVVLVNSFFGLERPAPYPPNIVFTGPTAPRPRGTVSRTSLPALDEWLAWVRAQGLGVVYLSMGSMMELKDWQVMAFYRGLEGIPGVAVAWSLKEKQQAFLPDAVDRLPRKFFVHKWMPQAEMIQRPEVAVVITHCGWGGSMETLTAGKPMVACPFRGDQLFNARLFKKKGLATVLSQKRLTAAAVEAETSKVLREPSYAAAAKEMQKALLKSGGSEKCAEVIEAAAVHGCEEVTVPAPSEVHAIAGLARRLALLGGAALAISTLAATRRHWLPGSMLGSIVQALAPTGKA